MSVRKQRICCSCISTAGQVPAGKKDLRAQIRELFPPLAETDLEFVKSCYGLIITPKLATGVHFSASRVLGLGAYMTDDDVCM